MSLVKSFSVGNGDMFYIKHGSDNFSIIDCCLIDTEKDRIIKEINSQRAGKNIQRFISSHPDDDHIKGLAALDEEIDIRNFYCVKNNTTKDLASDDFEQYCTLLDDTKKAFYLHKGCSRRWMNEGNDERGSAGINILWPITTNKHFKDALQAAMNGESPNNISCVVKYSLNDGATMLWMGDLETDFMKNIEDDFSPPKSDILFAPHHGRKSGKVPESWLKLMQPKIVVVGEAPSKELNYYQGFNTITQNSAGDIAFDCVDKKVHVYVSSDTYSVKFLVDEKQTRPLGNYIGTLKL